jgi:hypothetical protein
LALEFDAEKYAQLAMYRSRFDTQQLIPDAELGRMFDELASYLNCRIPPARAMAHYFKEMGNWPTGLVNLAFERARRNWTFSRMPLVGDFQRWIKHEFDDHARLHTDIIRATNCLSLPKRRAEIDGRRAAQIDRLNKTAREKYLAMSRDEREAMFRRYLKPEQAEQMIAVYDAIEAGAVA